MQMSLTLTVVSLLLFPTTRRQRAGRSAISLQHILNKRKRYDPKADKQQLFYAQAKQYKAYQRLLKREGYTTQPTHPHDTHNHDDEQQEQRQTKKRRRDDERQNEEEQDGTEQQQQRKERKEAELDEEGRVAEQKVDGEHGEGVEQTEQQWTGPGKKRRKRKEEPVVKSREQVQQEIEERQQKIADSRHVRAEKFKRHAQRTRKGQPVSTKQTASLSGAGCCSTTPPLLTLLLCVLCSVYRSWRTGWRSCSTNSRNRSRTRTARAAEILQQSQHLLVSLHPSHLLQHLTHSAHSIRALAHINQDKPPAICC